MEIKELGHVVLYVSDLEESVRFYRDILGFDMVAEQEDLAVFSSGRTHHELLLINLGREGEEKKGLEPGLYHIGFKVGDSPEEFKKVYEELEGEGVEIIGATDHGVTHSLYVLDPDGNEIELYADVSDEWKEDPEAILQPARELDLNGGGDSG